MTLTREDVNKRGLGWFSDPGHAWLGVEMSQVAEAGVAGQISSCSYMSKHGQIAYLEEDCDAPRFLAAIGFAYDGKVSIPETTPVRGNSFVRRLPAFQAPPATPEQALRALIVAHEGEGALGADMITEAHWREAKRAVGIETPAVAS